MFANLILTGLLAYGVAVASINANNGSYNNNNDHNISESISPKYAYNDNVISSGIYNLRNTFDFDNITDFEYDNEYVYTFEEPTSNLFLVPCWLYFSNNSGSGYRYCYLRELTITIESPIIEAVGPTTSIYYSVYDSNQGVSSSTFNISYDYDITDLSSNFRECIINLRDFYNFSAGANKLFNFFFTRDDNGFVESYNGYYNFNNGLSHVYNPICVFGFLNFNNSIYLGFTNNFGQGMNNILRFDVWSVETDNYAFVTYTLPFDRASVVSSNILINNAKIPSSVKTYMSNIGIFSYVRDTSLDNTTFHDLLFTIMDVPVYFITRFFSFELFGMNLAVAFAGLVTLAVMLFIIRIIWRLN